MITVFLKSTVRPWLSVARPLKRYLQRELETRIGRKLIAGEIPDGSVLHVDVVDGALRIEARPQEQPAH